MAVRAPGAGLPARPRLLMPVLLVLGVLLLLGGTVVSLYTDLLWFRSVDYSMVFTTVLTTKLLMFVLFGLLMAVLVGANIAIAYRMRPPFRPMSLEQQNLERYRVAVEPFLRTLLLVGSAVFGLFAGLSAAARWETWLLWRNGTDFGQVDAQFGRDIAYYAFTYPFLRFVLGFLLTAIILATIVAAATHYLFGGVRLQSGGEKVSPAARAHLSVLLGIVVLLKAYAYYLDRFGLAFSERGVVQGASFTDVNAVLPAKNILVGIAVVCALLFFANIVVRNIFIPVMALGLLVLSAVVIGGIYPAYTQQFRVKPNEVQREAEFIGRNIEATRQAYGIDDAVITPYAASQDADPAVLRQQASTVDTARLLDPARLAPTFEQLQRLTFYFGVNRQLDIDRYEVDGELQDFVVAAREVNINNLQGAQRSWINERLAYTHGNGLIAAPADRVDAEGRPLFAENPIELDQGRLYYGELSPTYSIVNTDQPEIDGPVGLAEGRTPAAGAAPAPADDESQATFNYDGKGGVQLTSLGRKLAYAVKYREPNLLLSDAIKSESRLMYVREPRERVQKVAPFLELDSDPYPAAVNGRIVWIVDGYTTSAGYPYSQRTVLGNATADSLAPSRLPQEEVNYIRNSVKATVDAYDGKVTLYAWDDQDPVLKAWQNIFPSSLKPFSEMSGELMSHVRYPEDLFKVQRELLGRYHVTQPDNFYTNNDAWSVPNDPTVQDDVKQPPYYMSLKMPDQDKPAFQLTSSFIPQVVNGNARNVLYGFLAADSDAGKEKGVKAESYGQLRLLQIPPEANVPGPGQAQNKFNSDPTVSQALNLLRQGASAVLNGNLLTLPVGGGMVYVQPVYLRSTGETSYPTLQRVLVAFGDKIGFAPTLDEALNQLFGGESGASAGDSANNGQAPATPDGTPAAPGGTDAKAELKAALEEANAAIKAGQEALAKGDFAAYGEQQRKLSAALQRAIDAEAKIAAEPAPAPAASPAPEATTPAATPAPTPSS